MVDYHSLPTRDELRCNLCLSIGNFININNIECCLDGCVYCSMRRWGMWGWGNEGEPRFSNGCKGNNVIYGDDEIVHLYLKNGLMLNQSINDILNRSMTIYPHRHTLSPPPDHIRNHLLLILGNDLNRSISLNDVLLAFNNINDNNRYSESEIFGYDLEVYINNNENEINGIRNNIDWNYHYPGLRTREILNIN